jgi:tRNA dimethylallyltransferase
MNKKPANKVFIILGPTCTGKTTLALDLCSKYSGEIISADSRQIYKYMDIGTGKVPLVEKSGSSKGEKFWQIGNTKVWGYDLVKPDELFSAYDYANFALSKIKELQKENKNVFLVGGTGFYLDIVTGKVKPSFVEPDPVLRKELEGLGAPELLERLKALTGDLPVGLDVKNPARIIRAIERAMKKNVNEKELPYLQNTKFYYTGLNAPREVLFSRADKWAEEVWKNGLLEETQKLIDMGYENSPKLYGLVYKSAVDFIKGLSEGAKSLERIKFDLHGYIRRQQTYFKKNGEIVWFDISKESYPKNIYNFIEGKLKNE